MKLTKPVLLIFLDGLKPENVNKVGLLDQLPSKTRVKGKFGYSIACHGSMYTGREVGEHKNWFVWQRDVGNGYLKHEVFRNPIFNNIPFRLFWHKFLIRSDKKRNTSFFGIPRAVHCNTRDLFDLKVTEVKNYDEYGYMRDAKSFIDEFREEDLSIDMVGFSQKYKEESQILDEWSPTCLCDVTYWFLGDVDHFSHKSGQESAIANSRFQDLSCILERAISRFRKFYQTEPLILAWSDHGHAMVEETIDIYSMKKLGRLLKKTTHVTDSTGVRFWRNNEDEGEWENKILLLDHLLGDFSIKLDHEAMTKRNLWPGDNRFGDIVYMLKKGFTFKRSIWGFGSNVVSQHGYDPDDKELDGFAASNCIDFGNKVRWDITKIQSWAKKLTNKASVKNKT